MSDRLSAGHVAVLVAYALAMAGGQALFKAAALHGAEARSLGERVLGSLLNLQFASAIILYGALTILWVWILSFVPLSRAYPFVALGFAITPALGVLIFGEPMSLRLMIGIGLIMCGLYLTAT
jgi:multidrug transporter EmrE-like cation transporter